MLLQIFSWENPYYPCYSPYLSPCMDLYIQLATYLHGIVLIKAQGSFAAYVRFEIFTAATMKNAIIWDVMPCGSCKNRRFGGT
jgi:hypothetical protein